MARIAERTTAAGARRLYIVFNADCRVTGRRRKFWELQRGGKKEANARKAAIEAGLWENGGLWPLEAPADPEPDVPTLDEYAATWLDERAALKVTPRVLENYRAAVRLHLAPALGSMPIDTIRRKHVNDLVHALAARGLARNTIRNGVLTPLRSLLYAAVDDELIDSNPAARVVAPEQAPVRETTIPTSDELTRILEHASQDAADAITLMASLGLRRGEAFALTWGDVDLDEGILTVHSSNHRGIVTERTKSKASKRLVPIFSTARAMLEARRDRLGPENTWPLTLVFTNAFGGAVDPGNWRRREWLPALEAAGIPAKYRIHDLRHYAVTRLDELGMAGALRTAIAGHSAEEITNAVYTHVNRARIAEAAGLFDPLREAGGHAAS